MGSKSKTQMVMVTGCPRSGSTVMSRILASARGTVYVEEPLNHEVGIIGASEPFVFLQEDSPLTTQYDEIIEDILSGSAKYKPSAFQPTNPGLTRRLFYAAFINRYHAEYRLGTLNNIGNFTYVSKDPLGSLSSEYLHQKFNYKILLTLRHPCGVIASHQQLGWRSPIELFLKNRDLMQQLSPAFRKLDVSKLSEIEKLAWYWRAINEILEQFALRNPHMLLVEHEHFSEEPEEVVRKIYDWADLLFSKRVQNKVRRMTDTKNTTDPRPNKAHTLRRNSKENSRRWEKLLSPAEIKAVNNITQPLYLRMHSLPNNLLV